MASLHTLRLKPGVDVEQSAFLNATQLTASNLIRWYAGLPEKLGGWLQMCATALVGICRGLHGWSDIVGNAYLAAGTEQRLEVLSGGTLYDITPIVQTDNPAVAFSTSIGSPTVTITDAGRSPAAGDWINLQTQVSVGGIVVFGFYQIASLISGTQYTITAASNATANVIAGGAVPAYTTTNTMATVSVLLNAHGYTAGTSVFDAAVTTTVATVVIFGNYTVTSITDVNNFVITATSVANATTTASENAGNARIEYLLPTGLPVNTGLFGYGSGLYGSGLYGGSSGGGAASIALLRQWSLDNFGQDLIASPSNGAIYFWQPPVVAPAVIVDVTAPIYNIAVFVMPQAEIIVALGSEVGTTQEPLLIRWCDVADFTDWTASATNQAGSYTIPTGSKLVGGLAVGLGAWIWTDQDAWVMTYLGFPLVFGFNNIAKGCGLAAQRAMGAIGAELMWLGLHQFYQASTSGGVHVVECPVWDFYFANMDFSQMEQVHCAVNEVFNEMAWHFPLKTSSPLWNALNPMGYVKVNIAEPGRPWDYGLSSQYQRTAWTGHSPVGNPVGADFAGLLQQHEQGYDANGVGMQWSWQTGFWTLQEGDDFIYSDLIIPDFVTLGTSPVFVPTVLTTDYPQEAVVNVITPMITQGSNWITYSGRGRYFALAMAGSDLGTFNRLGGLKWRGAPDGKN